MTVIPTVEFFADIPEAIENVSLRRNKESGERSVVMTFGTLKCIEQFRALSARFNKTLRLRDEEGEISVEPSGVRFVFGGPEGDDLERLECKFDIARDDHWDRFMRFMNRYAEANGMGYSDTAPPPADAPPADAS